MAYSVDTGSVSIFGSQKINKFLASFSDLFCVPSLLQSSGHWDVGSFSVHDPRGWSEAACSFRSSLFIFFRKLLISSVQAHSIFGFK